MHTLIRRAAIVAGATTTVLALGAGSALAHECINPNKQPAAGTQVTFGPSGPTDISNVLQQRIDRGIVDMETGDGFHGLVGIDEDGDGVADISTWQVTPTGSIPMVAQTSGADCNGVVFVGDYLTDCLGE